jgi:drug/metabolite transporter, DME family
VVSRSSSRLFVLAAALLFSVGGAGIKACALTSWQVASFRSGIAAVFVWAVLPSSRTGWTWRTGAVGLAYAATVTLFVLANKLTTSANTIFLQSTAPLYVLLLGPWLLREHLRARDLALMAIVAAGMALLLTGADHPLATAPDPFRGNILAALSGLTWALTVIGLRWIGRAEHRGGGAAGQAVVAGNLIACLAGLPMALPVLQSRPVDWAIVAGLGIVQIGFAYLFLAAAMRQVPALEASVLLLLEPVLNPIWAWIIQGERARAGSILGGAIILAATLVRAWMDRRPAEPAAVP